MLVITIPKWPGGLLLLILFKECHCDNQSPNIDKQTIFQVIFGASVQHQDITIIFYHVMVDVPTIFGMSVIYNVTYRVKVGFISIFLHMIYS